MFSTYRQNTIGDGYKIDGIKPLTYMDWTASGRLYAPIENYLTHTIGPLVANTHTETSYTGKAMTQAYEQARDVVKQHINAKESDALLFCGNGMTGAIHKLQRMMRLKNGPYRDLDKQSQPLVIVTHMEHHSNHTSWLECDVDVKVLDADNEGYPSPHHLKNILNDNKHRLVIGSFTACSNVTGALVDYLALVKLVKAHGGIAILDFAASAPYVEMNMHPESGLDIDALVFSPHKFLGGPGTPGVLAFSKSLYQLEVPDSPGGGTVKWTNPWGEHAYYPDIEAREEGGTPGFIQAIKAALAIKLKEEMGIQEIAKKDEELNNSILPWLINDVPNLKVLAHEHTRRLPIYSVYFEHLHYNLVVRLLSDRYGIQVRGGCACAGTYGHWLLNVSPSQSAEITKLIDEGDLSAKPGWIRISLHPTTSQAEIDLLKSALLEISENGEEWGKSYRYETQTGEYVPTDGEASINWLDLPKE